MTFEIDELDFVQAMLERLIGRRPFGLNRHEEERYDRLLVREQELLDARAVSHADSQRADATSVGIDRVATMLVAGLAS